MRILDQRKETIINTDHIREIYACYDGKVKGLINDTVDILILGEYNSKEEAKKVVNQIFNCMQSYLRTYEMPKKGN